MEATKVAPKVKKFALILAAIGTQGEKVEGMGASLLSSLRAQGVKTLEDFDAAITAAYQVNGWNTRQGRPSAEKREKVPNTVRTYVWEMRSALKDGIHIWTCKTFYELRIARAKARKAPVVAAESSSLPKLPELQGVRITGVDAPNGALFHDLALVFAVIPEAQRTLLSRSLERLLRAYQGAAGVAPKVAESPGKKKATG